MNKETRQMIIGLLLLIVSLTDLLAGIIEIYNTNYFISIFFIIVGLLIFYKSIQLIKKSIQ
jgi:hypothetical protein